MARKKLDQLVLEDAGAAWLEEDERHAGFDLGRHAVENVLKVPPRAIKQAEVIKRTATADVPARDFDAKSGARKNGLRGEQGLRMVIVVPGIRPQKDLRCGGFLD